MELLITYCRQLSSIFIEIGSCKVSLCSVNQGLQLGLACYLQSQYESPRNLRERWTLHSKEEIEVEALFVSVLSIENSANANKMRACKPREANMRDLFENVSV